MAQGYFCCLVYCHSTHRAQYHLNQHHSFDAFRSHDGGRDDRDRGRDDGGNGHPNGSGYERKRRGVGAAVPLGEITHERWG